MKDPITDLADRLALLKVRHNVVFGTPGPTAPEYVSPHCVRMAEIIADGLMIENAEMVGKARGVVDPADLGGTEFWATALGRLLFAAGGYGAREDETIGQAFAAGVLGCSRQWVNELVARGELTSAVSSQVRVDQVRVLLKTRMDKLVK
jgi:hypothetical protein